MKYSEDQLTGWFDVEKQKPWEPGVYVVDEDSLGTWYAYWNGESFGRLYLCPYDAKNRRNRHTNFVVTKWRGLSKKPNAKPKRSGNKRKVMYVVCCQRPRCTLAGFAKKENAQKYAEHLNFPVYITKIRFRTPEQD